MNGDTAMRPQHTIEDVEIQEWLESLDSVLETSGPEVAAEILERH
jgi:pyruvate dehydrogenase complex dehydrogenase (E1) component